MSVDISPYSKELWPPIEVMVLAGWQKIKYVIIKLKVDTISQLPNIIEINCGWINNTICVNINEQIFSLPGIITFTYLTKY